MILKQKTNAKYGNDRVIYNGEQFDSKKEARRYQQLLLMQKAGAITDLRRQVSFELIPSQYVGGKCVERAVKYVADFVYLEGGNTVLRIQKGQKLTYISSRRSLCFTYTVSE